MLHLRWFPFKLIFLNVFAAAYQYRMIKPSLNPQPKWMENAFK
jgi:hypothetical protein